MNKDRAIELATWVMHGLIEDDRESAIEFLHDTACLTLDELEFFGVELTEEELEKYWWSRTCPECGMIYYDRPALSRKDNETLICPDCGTKEAMEDMMKGK